MNETQQPIQFAGAELGECSHVCAFFRSPDEENEVLLPFIQEGLARGDRAVLIAGPATLSHRIQLLNTAGIDTRRLELEGLLEIRRWEDEYLNGGCFNQDAMLSRIVALLEGGISRGHAHTRLVGHMEWALEGGAVMNDLVEYEARLNETLPGRSGVVICAYEAAKFTSGVVLDILRTHPMVLIGGILQRNPFYIPPQKFLKEYRERSSYSSQ